MRHLFVLSVFLLLILRPSGAHAEVCEPFAARLTQPRLEQLAAQVRELFPERHRQALGAVKVMLEHDRYDVLQLEEGERGAEIVVSDTYLQSSCSLAMWPLIFTPEREDLRREITSDLSRTCIESDEQGRRTCMLGFMNGVADGWEQNLTDRSEVEVQTPLVRQMVMSSFIFALAHEYGHVLTGQPGNPFAKLAARDSELAADLQALSIYASGRAWPAADALLFAGRREYDSLLGGDGVQAAAHDASYCRARRSAEIRSRLVPAISAINIWRSGQDVSFVLSIVPVLMNGVTIPVPEAKLACDLTLPPQLTAMVADLTALARWTATWPADQPAREAAIRTLLAMPMATEAGKTTRAGMIVSYTLEPAQKVLNQTLEGSLEPATAQAWAARFAMVEALTARQGDMPLRDRNKLKAAQAFSRFLALPRGTFTLVAAQSTTADLERVFADGVPDPVDQMAMGALQLIAGDCEKGLGNIIALAKALQAPMNEFLAVVTLAGQRDLADYRKTRDEYAATANGLDQAGANDAAAAKCAAASPLLRQRLAARLGWSAEP